KRTLSVLRLNPRQPYPLVKCLFWDGFHVPGLFGVILIGRCSAAGLGTSVGHAVFPSGGLIFFGILVLVFF
ncbi:hypothetical protein GOODEAATRI_014053, partial [Goodea atripinnis]